MNVHNRVKIKTNGGPLRVGKLISIQHFNKNIMYLVVMEDYPLGIWFIKELETSEEISLEIY